MINPQEKVHKLMLSIYKSIDAALVFKVIKGYSFVECQKSKLTSPSLDLPYSIGATVRDRGSCVIVDWSNGDVDTYLLEKKSIWHHVL